jgi:hypothetical protein
LHDSYYYKIKGLPGIIIKKSKIIYLINHVKKIECLGCDHKHERNEGYSVLTKMNSRRSILVCHVFFREKGDFREIVLTNCKNLGGGGRGASCLCM